MQYLKEDIRQNILDSAKKKFLEKGYADTSMREIAEDVGIVSGNIYHYFHSKEDIFEGVVSEVGKTIAEIEKTDYLDNIDVQTLNSDEIKTAVMSYLSLFEGDFCELFIVLNRSVGTGFEGTNESLKNTVFSKAKRLFFDNIGVGVSDDVLLILETASNAYIDGINKILFLNFNDEAKLKKLVGIWTDTILNGLKTCI